jgi:predicted metalloprotease with PDZ domain
VGIAPDESEKNNFKIASVRPNSPAAAAGLEEGDGITSFGGIRLTPANFLKTVSRYKPGDRVPVVLQRGGKVIRLTLALGEPLLFNYRIEENASASAEAKALRTAWLQNRLR